MCYDGSHEMEGKFFNRFGTIRLLNAIAGQCPFLKLNDEWNTIMNQHMPTPSTSQQPPTYREKLQKGIQRNRSYDQHHQFTQSRQNQSRTVNNYQSDYPRRRFQVHHSQVKILVTMYFLNPGLKMWTPNG